MLNRRYIVFAVTILVLSGFIFIFSKRAVDISLNTSVEVGHEVVLKYPFWVSESRARESFDIKPDIPGELQWLGEENELHFVPIDGFEAEVDYTISASNNLLALLPLSQDKTIQVSLATLQNYTKSKINDDTYIDVNLATMTLSLYKDGRLYKSLPVAGKGHPRLTPTVEGEFSIKTKELNHFSKIAHVWMPLSMQFYGNYFIHAWPYWPGGAKLRSKYSGGCLRLFDKDAQEVYNFASIGMTMLVHSTPSHKIGEINDGDLVYLESDPDVYWVQVREGMRFKRVLPGGKILSWYPHFSPLDEHLKLVSKDVLDRFQSSRWVFLAGSDEIYEINKGRKHLMTCGDNRCIDIWEEYGWDARELYILSEEELSSYHSGDDIELPRAPWTQ